ncbi:MAG: MATE family efflux transporter [Lentisphaeria bacterium]|nr:MATE family efflux transporter [Lentisphaeria bacterium]
MALQGGRDLTRGNVFWNLLTFTLPFLAANFLQVLYGAVDLLIIGHFGGGSVGVSAVASGCEVLHLLMSLIMGLTAGATVLIGQYYGAGDSANVRRSVGMTLSFSLLLSILLTLITLLLAPYAVHWIHTPSEAVEPTRQYVRICAAGLIFVVGYNALASIFRGFGNSVAPLIFVGIACAINVAGDLLFVAVMKMGVAGAALATILSQGLSMAAALWYLNAGDFGFRFRRRNFIIHWDLAWRYLKIGTPIAIQGSMVGLSFVFIFAIVNTMGVAASAGYGICGRINGFAMLPAFSFSMAMAAITAQNIGAGKPYRALQTLRHGIACTMTFGVIALVGLQIWPRHVIEWFIDPAGEGAEAAIIAGCQYLRSVSWEYVLVPIVFCTNGFFNGCGRTFFSMCNNLGFTFFARVPASYFFGTMPGATLFELGFAAPLASFASNIVALFYLWSGRWRDRRRHHSTVKQ